MKNLLEEQKKALLRRLTIGRVVHKDKKSIISAIRNEFSAEAFRTILESVGSEGINFTMEFSIISENRELFEQIMHWDGHAQFSPAAFDVLWSIDGIASIKVNKDSNLVRVNKSKRDCIKGDGRTVFWMMASQVEEFLNKNDLVIGE